MRNQSVCVCMYVCRCLTNLHLPPEDPTSCHEETPNSRTQCCSEDFCNTRLNYKGPIPGESCLPPPPPPPPAPPRPHTRPSHAHSWLIHRHICERNILTTSHLRPRAPLCASVEPRPCHCTASSAFFRQNFVAHTHHTHITNTHLFTTSPSHTHSHTSLSCCTPSTVPLRLAPALWPAPCTCNMCVLCLRFLGFLTHTPTHTRVAHAHLYLLLLSILTLSASTHNTHRPPLASTPLLSTRCVC